MPRILMALVRFSILFRFISCSKLHIFQLSFRRKRGVRIARKSQVCSSSIYFPYLLYTHTNFPSIDAEILNLALSLELLERAFYERGLSRFSKEDFKKAGYPDWVRGRFEQIFEHEKTHVQFLESALTTAGDDYVKPCEYILYVSFFFLSSCFDCSSCFPF